MRTARSGHARGLCATVILGEPDRDSAFRLWSEWWDLTWKIAAAFASCEERAIESGWICVSLECKSEEGWFIVDAEIIRCFPLSRPEL